MRILAIETSCDETAISIIEAAGTVDAAHFCILGNQLLSQVDLHREYGGVYPNLAKREHAKNLVPILEETLHEAKLFIKHKSTLDITTRAYLRTLLKREPALFEQLVTFLESIEKPDIDAIAVTYGPGLEPALWVGINFARALGNIWRIKIHPVNHMEGHIFAGLLETQEKKEEWKIKDTAFPLLALLISGGHTELVLMKEWGMYEKIGETRDDAVGEAFDKVARLLGLPYPGGLEISKLAERARTSRLKLPKSGILSDFKLPRPMIKSADFDFSFSGLKTAVLYTILKLESLNEKTKQLIAREFEEAVTEVLIRKTKKAAEHYGVQTLVVGGGVSANRNIRKNLKEAVEKMESPPMLLIPEQKLTTDNAVMIGVAGYYTHLLGRNVRDGALTAQGNLSL